MVVINPGNPTGQVLSEQTIEIIINFCAKNRIVIFADEVYQENIYKKNTKFESFKKVHSRLQSESVLFSFHSTSKGLVGECGFRGGYFEAVNLDQELYELFVKIKSINLCSNTSG